MSKRTTVLWGGVLLYGLAVAPYAWAQNSGGSVDMSVADRDLLATSLRRIEPGNAQFSFQNRLTVANFNAGWSPFDPASPTATDSSTGLTHSHGYQYRSPGLRALIDRPEYVPVRGGGEVMIIPANTVFQLTLERPSRPTDPRPKAHENFRDQRMNHASSGPSSGASFGHGSAGFQDLRVQRIPVSEIRPIPHPSQMRFPQAAFPNGWNESQAAVTAAAVELDPETVAAVKSPTESADSDDVVVQDEGTAPAVSP